MLRITAHDVPGSVTIQLEGVLSGKWVHELQACLQETLAARSKPTVRIDLKEVTYIDAAGRGLLAAAHAEGAELIASGCLMRSIVAEITRPAGKH